MRLIKSIRNLKMPDFKEWLEKFTSFFTLENIRQRITIISSSKRLILMLGILIFFAGLEVMVGINFLSKTNSELIRDNLFNKDLRIISKIKTELIKLPIVYNEELAGIAATSARNISHELKQEVNHLSRYNQNLQEFKLFKASLMKIAGYVSEPVVFQNYYEIWAEVGKTRLYLDKFETQIRLAEKKAAKPALNYVGFLIFLGLLFISSGFLVYFIVKEIKGHQSALKHFVWMAEEFKKGNFELATLPYQTLELVSLQNAFTGYIQRLSQRYDAIISHISSLNPLIRKLSAWLAKNDTQHLKIKHSLREYTEKAYHNLDRVSGLTERIKVLNNNLESSQQEASNLLESIEAFRDILMTTIESLTPIITRVEAKGQYYQEVIDKLKELKNLLDQIQQTVTVFYGIAEQTTLLALNASIEAARAGESGDNFDITAMEIEELASKINGASKNLSKISVLIGKKAISVLHLLEASYSQNKSEAKNLHEIWERLKNFETDFDRHFAEVKDYGHLIQEFEAKGQALEKMTSVLANLKNQSPDNHKKAIAALDVIIETEKLVVSVGELDENVVNLKQTLKHIHYKSTLEEQ